MSEGLFHFFFEDLTDPPGVLWREDRQKMRVLLWFVLLLVCSERRRGLLALSSVGAERRVSRRILVAAAPSLFVWPAGADVYTKEEYCRQSDRETRRGIAYGCEEFATDPDKIALMVSRALVEVAAAAEALEAVPPITNARDGGQMRQTLRLGALGALRKDGKRLIILEGNSDDIADSYAKTIAAIEALDLISRRLELDDGVDALLTANSDLGKAQQLLRSFVDLLQARATDNKKDLSSTTS